MLLHAHFCGFGQFLGNSKNGICPKNRHPRFRFWGFPDLGNLGIFFSYIGQHHCTVYLHRGVFTPCMLKTKSITLINFFLPKLPKIKKSASMVSFGGVSLGNSLKIIAQLFAQLFAQMS